MATMYRSIARIALVVSVAVVGLFGLPAPQAGAAFRLPSIFRPKPPPAPPYIPPAASRAGRSS